MPEEQRSESVKWLHRMFCVWKRPKKKHPAALLWLFYPALNEHSLHHKARAAPWLSFHASTSLKLAQRLKKKTGPNVFEKHIFYLLFYQYHNHLKKPDLEAFFSAAAHSFLLCVVWVELGRTDPLSHINISRTCGGNTQWKSRVLLTADSKRTRTREQLTASKRENKKVMKKWKNTGDERNSVWVSWGSDDRT